MHGVGKMQHKLEKQNEWLTVCVQPKCGAMLACVDGGELTQEEVSDHFNKFACPSKPYKKEKLKPIVKGQKIIIYAGVRSSSYDEEAQKLADTMEELGYEVIRTIPINGLDRPKIEYIKECSCECGKGKK